jgi:hypothetical protein
MAVPSPAGAAPSRIFCRSSADGVSTDALAIAPNCARRLSRPIACSRSVYRPVPNWIGRARRASRSAPERIRVSERSTEAISHPSWIHSRRTGEKTGFPAFPVRNPSMHCSTACRTWPASRLNCRRTRGMSDWGSSRNFARRCSTVTS